jgi:hypothetical protein
VLQVDGVGLEHQPGGGRLVRLPQRVEV